MAISPENLDETDVPDLVTLLARAAARWPGRVAVEFPATGESASFADFERRTGQVANALIARGIVPGARVALMLRNRLDWPAAWLGIMKAGAVMVPVNVFYQPADAGYLLDHAGVSAVICERDLVEIVEDAIAEIALPKPPAVLAVGPGEGDFAAEISAASAEPAAPVPAPDSLVNIQYTSGTTGRPKGCMLTHEWFLGFARRMQLADFRLEETDTVLTAQPFYYVDPQWQLATTLLAGARLVVLDRFHPSGFWDAIREHGATWFYCLGVMPKMLLNQPETSDDRNHGVRLAVCSAIPPADHARIEARWGVPWYEAFGLTETGLDIAVSADEHDALVGTGCIGRAMAEREVRIVDGEGREVPRGQTGELVERGPGMLTGYYRNEEATRAALRDGWFHTGDLARMDGGGRVFFEGRKKDMIRRSGENISAVEVEEILMQHPAVALAACVPVPDDTRGEEVKAYVVPKEGDGIEAPALAEWCAGRIAYFKVPRYWTFRESLPRTPSERVIKSALTAGVDDLRRDAWDRATGDWFAKREP